MPKPYKILCTDKDPQWLAHRSRLVTASEAYSLFYEDRPDGKKWPKTRRELVWEKANPIGAFPDSRNMWHGRDDEDHNRKKFGRICGVRSKAAHWLLESSLVPGLGATLDGICIAPQRRTEPQSVACSGTWPSILPDTLRMYGGVGILEMKQTESFFGKEWKTGVPEHYKHQVWAQLVVAGFDWAVIACQIGAADMEAHVIEHPGQVHIDTLREAVSQFWVDVEAVKKELHG
jgi:predicted phage-related endonuclease